jgi:hypothetical protein
LPDLIVAGRLLGASLACGFNLYAMVALVGLASRLGWIDVLPAGIRGLENGIIIGSAMLLFVLQVAATAVRYLDATWEAIHTLVRPVAATTLALLALEAAPWPLRLAGALAAGTAALTAHVARIGLHVVAGARPVLRVMFGLLEDLIAVALAIAALVLPAAAALVVAIFVLLMVIVGPKLARATAFGVRAVAARMRGFFGTRGWHDPREMPQSLRKLVPPTGIASPAPRAVRATLGPARGSPAWRNGWIVFDAEGVWFLYRGLMGARRIPLPETLEASIREGFLTDVVEVRAAEKNMTFFLLKDGPPAETTLGALRTVKP